MSLVGYYPESLDSGPGPGSVRHGEGLPDEAVAMSLLFWDLLAATLSDLKEVSFFRKDAVHSSSVALVYRGIRQPSLRS